MVNLFFKYIWLIGLLGISCSSIEVEKRTSPQLNEIWKYGYFPASGITSYPAIVGDSLILMVGDLYLTSLRIKDGKVKWRTKVSDVISLQGEHLMIGDGYVFNTHVQDLRGWDLDTGEEVWRLDFPEDRGFTSYSTIQDNIIYYSGKSQVRAIQALGDIIYEVDIKSGPNTAVIHGDKLYVGHGWNVPAPIRRDTFGRMTCLDAQTGDSLWAFETTAGGFYYTPPIIENGIVYCGTTSDYSAFYALDAENGQLLWNVDSMYAFHAILEGDVIYVNNGNIIALDKHDGTILWETNLLAGHGSGILSYLDGYLYHAHPGALFILDAQTGEIVQKIYAEDETVFWYAITGVGKVFVQSSNHLYCFDPWTAE